MKWLIALVCGLIPAIPAIAYVSSRRRALVKVTRETILGFSVLNLLVALAMVGVGATCGRAPPKCGVRLLP